VNREATVTGPSGVTVEARAALLELGGRDAAPLAAAIEQLPSHPAFGVMAAASRAARPQWAGVLDDLYERPMLCNARLGLRNALASTLRGDTLYRSAFFAFADAVVLWHYGHTQERRGGGRVEVIYDTLLRLLREAVPGSAASAPVDYDLAFFHGLRRIRLTRDHAYPLLRRAARLLAAVEAQHLGEPVRPVRGSLFSSYISFSAQVIAMARALSMPKAAIDQGDVRVGVAAIVRLIGTSPEDLASGP